MIKIACPHLGEEELKAVKRVFKSKWLGLGKEVFEFENQLKKFFNIKNVVCVNSGTAAIHLALDTIGVSKNDEVIVPSLTFPAPIQAIIACAAKPVFCDIYPDIINLDIEDVKRKITSKTKAILPVHYNGIPNKMDELLQIAKKYNLKIIEDAAHGFGSTYKGKKLGTIGDVGCFSFDPIKTITSIEGGAVITNDDRLANVVRIKRNLGINIDTWHRYKNKKSLFYEVINSGYRYHMSNVNAAVGLVQLKKIDKFIKRKKLLVERYNKTFRQFADIEFLNINYKNTLPLFYIVKIKKNRDLLMKFLSNKGIHSTIYYIPNHLQPFFRKYPVSLPVTEKVWKELIILPLYYAMTDKQQNYVINSVKSFFKKCPK